MQTTPNNSYKYLKKMQTIDLIPQEWPIHSCTKQYKLYIKNVLNALDISFVIFLSLHPYKKYIFTKHYFSLY